MPKRVAKTVRLAVIKNCHECAHAEAPVHTPGSGYAQDYYCNAVTPKRKFVGYVEWPSEKRKDHDFPDWCPLQRRTVRE